MNTEFFHENEHTQREPGYQTVSRVEVWKQQVKFERYWGQTPTGHIVSPCYIARCYENVTVTSLQRLHNTISRLVNRGDATISLHQIAIYGISYEVEL